MILVIHRTSHWMCVFACAYLHSIFTVKKTSVIKDLPTLKSVNISVHSSSSSTSLLNNSLSHFKSTPCSSLFLLVAVYSVELVEKKKRAFFRLLTTNSYLIVHGLFSATNARQLTSALHTHTHTHTYT